MDHIGERVREEMRRSRENRQRRAAWEQQKKQEAEEEKRREKRADLAAHIQARSEAWRDHVGDDPTAGLLARWTEEFVAQRASEEEIRLEFARAEAEDIAGS